MTFSLRADTSVPLLGLNLPPAPNDAFSKSTNVKGSAIYNIRARLRRPNGDGRKVVLHICSTFISPLHLFRMRSPIGCRLFLAPFYRRDLDQVQVWRENKAACRRDHGRKRCSRRGRSGRPRHRGPRGSARRSWALGAGYWTAVSNARLNPGITPTRATIACVCGRKGRPFVVERSVLSYLGYGISFSAIDSTSSIISRRRLGSLIFVNALINLSNCKSSTAITTSLPSTYRRKGGRSSLTSINLWFNLKRELDPDTSISDGQGRFRVSTLSAARILRSFS